MGIRDALRIGTGATPNDVVTPQIIWPWGSTDQLSSIVWADILDDTSLLPMTRAEAMSVPAAARARHLLCGSIAGCPLVVLTRQPDGTDVQLVPPAAPTWTYRTDGPVSPWHRMLWTVDDLLWFGWSLWSVDRDSDAQVIRADRLPFDRWSFGDDGTVLVDNKPAQARDVVLIPGPHEGLLNFAQRTLRAASKLERSAARHASNPVPSVELRQTLDVQLTEAERDELIAGWVAARSSENGAVGFTSYGIEAHPLGAVPEQLLIDGRNAAAVDVARHVSIPASMLDATNAGASMTYQTVTGRNAQYVDYGVTLYTGAIEARLSLDDVVPRGSRTRFDLTDLTSLTESPTGPVVPD